MKSKLAPLFIFALILLVSSLAFAGEDVELLDANGNKLMPSQIDDVNIANTCGTCHEVGELAQSVHSNMGEADPEAASCLSCHISSGKDAFTADGLIKKNIAHPEDVACTNCHGMEEVAQNKAHTAHPKMSCYDCHQSAGHQKKPDPSCQDCHLKGSGTRPVHKGLPALHLDKITCEACHIRQIAGSKTQPGFTMLKNGDVVPVTEDGSVVYHNVAPASKAFGAGGCDDCHSRGSKFFFGTTSLDSDGKVKKTANYKQMGLDKESVFFGGIREQVLKPVSGWLFLGVLVLSLLHYLIFGPHKVQHVEGEPMMHRFTVYERLIHLLAISSFLYLAITGLLLLLKVETPAGHIRAIHGPGGAFFLLAVVGMLLIWWKNGLFVSCDKDWVCKMGGYLWIKGDCPAEKFNAGQKMFYWGIVILTGGLVAVTGLILMIKHSAAASWVYTLHDLAAIVMIVGILGHVYLSVFANPGTISGVIIGRVRHSWAKHHHSQWFERHKGQDKQTK